MSSGPRVRLAGQDDAATVRELLDALADAFAGEDVPFESGPLGRVFEHFLSRDRGCILLAEDDDEVLGMIAVSFNLALRYRGEYAQIEELSVSEAARGKNVGARLVDAAMDAARARGCAEIGLYAGERTRPFYEKMGFICAGAEMRRRLS